MSDRVHIDIAGRRTGTVVGPSDVVRRRAPTTRTLALAGAAERQIFTFAYNAVKKASGAPPTHILVGWHDYLELAMARCPWLSYHPRSPDDDTPTLRFQGVELVIDTRHEHAIVAVPRIKHAVLGKPVPLGAAWQWSPATAWTRRPQ